MTGRVLVVGDIVTDVVAVLGGPIAHASDTPATITVAGGGAGANTATWLAHLGTEVTLCAVTGADGAGAERAAELAAHGVDLAVRRATGVATGTIVVLADRSERTMITDRGANLRLAVADVAAALAATPDAVHVHLSGYPLLDAASRPAARHALAAAAGRGLTTSVDAASAGPLRRVGGPEFLSWVRGCDVLFANVDEARALLATGAGAGADGDGDAEILAARLARLSAALVVVKVGAAGAVAATRDGAVAIVPAVAVEAVDATGAGDAFAAGFLRSWLDGADLVRALDAGTALGARAVATVGARPPRPS